MATTTRCVVVALFSLCLLISLPGSRYFSNHTDKHAFTRRAECVVTGNEDLYGIGIRIGFYLQILAAAITAFGDRDKCRSILATNLWFALALLVALTYLSAHREIYVSEVFVSLNLLRLMTWFNATLLAVTPFTTSDPGAFLIFVLDSLATLFTFFSNPKSVLKKSAKPGHGTDRNNHPPVRENVAAAGNQSTEAGTPAKEPSSAEFPVDSDVLNWNFQVVVSVMLLLSVEYYATWFWWKGLNNLQHGPCGDVAFFFSKVSLHGWFRIWHRVVNSIVVVWFTLGWILIFTTMNIGLKAYLKTAGKMVRRAWPFFQNETSRFLRNLQKLYFILAQSDSDSSRPNASTVSKTTTSAATPKPEDGKGPAKGSVSPALQPPQNTISPAVSSTIVVGSQSAQLPGAEQPSTGSETSQPTKRSEETDCIDTSPSKRSNSKKSLPQNHAAQAADSPAILRTSQDQAPSPKTIEHEEKSPGDSEQSLSTDKHFTRFMYGSLWLVLAPYLTYFILSIELTIKWNHFTNVNHIPSTGQLIPFIIGMGSATQGLWRLIRQVIRRLKEDVERQELGTDANLS
ncbi:MAG: hypothetical protein Q9227_001206 [Pyrenula ochraceoflavens]